MKNSLNLKLSALIVGVSMAFSTHTLAQDLVSTGAQATPSPKVPPLPEKPPTKPMAMIPSSSQDWKRRGKSGRSSIFRGRRLWA